MHSKQNRCIILNKTQSTISMKGNNPADQLVEPDCEQPMIEQ